MKRIFILLTAAACLFVSMTEARNRFDNEDDTRQDSTETAADSTALRSDSVKADTVKIQKEPIKNPIWLHGMVADGFTKAAIPDVFVTLMQQDSTVVDTTRVYTSNGYTWGIGRTGETTGYCFGVKREPAHYILRFEHPNYETTYADVPVKSVGKRRQDIEGPRVYMKKVNNNSSFEGGDLDEVVVRATKVKMVWKGDTLVFNADAFNVPEGSMLDALIKQLPGVELKDNGEIFVNGKKIDNLTLNGADFFKGNNKVMLENLPHFTVKNVQVYNKQTAENKYYGIDDEDKKEYTMDVVLKREYSIGGSANVEAGYGTDDRYKVKGFGLRFSDRTRAVLFGGTNNINEATEFNQEDEEYKDRTSQAGDRHFRQLGAMFTYLGSEGKLNNSTEVRTDWAGETGEQRTNSETFMDGGSTFGQSETHSHSRPVGVELRNTFQMTVPFHLYSRASLNYQRNRYDSEGWNISTGDAQNTDSISRTWYRSNNDSEYLTGRLSGDVGLRLHTGDNIRMSFGGYFYRTLNTEYTSLSQYRYYKLGTSEDRDRRTLSPQRNYQLNAQLQYNYQLKNMSFSPYYGLNKNSMRNEREEYQRDEIDYIRDITNSYETYTDALNQKAGMNINFYKSSEKGYFSIYGHLELDFLREKMRYDKQEIKRHYTYFDPYLSVYYQKRGDGRSRRFDMTYYQYTRQPSVTQLLSRPNTSDPMNIFLGNDALKMSTTHRIYGNYSLNRDSIDQMMSFRVEYSNTSNSISNGNSYDLTTGIRTYRPENIASGNWSVNTTVSWNRALGKKKLWHIGNSLTLTYDKSTSLANVIGSTSSDLSRVGSVRINYQPNVSFQKNNLTMQLKGSLQYRNMHRSLELSDALPTDIWDFSYGFMALYKLPYNFTIDTDLQMRSRRGYADSEMNDNRIYWDASITKSFKAGRWVMKLRGYDLLGQVSNLYYYVNSQGRTETWTNSLRRYALFTVSYRFTKTPKKK